MVAGITVRQTGGGPALCGEEEDPALGYSVGTVGGIFLAPWRPEQTGHFVGTGSLEEGKRMAIPVNRIRGVRLQRPS